MVLPGDDWALNLYVGASWNTWCFGGSFALRQDCRCGCRDGDREPARSSAISLALAALCMPWLSAALANYARHVNLVAMRG